MSLFPLHECSLSSWARATVISPPKVRSPKPGSPPDGSQRHISLQLDFPPQFRPARLSQPVPKSSWWFSPFVVGYICFTAALIVPGPVAAAAVQQTKPGDTRRALQSGNCRPNTTSSPPPDAQSLVQFAVPASQAFQLSGVASHGCGIDNETKHHPMIHSHSLGGLGSWTPLCPSHDPLLVCRVVNGVPRSRVPSHVHGLDPITG